MPSFRINEKTASQAQLRDLTATLELFGGKLRHDSEEGLVCSVPDELLWWGVGGGLGAYLEAHADLISWSLSAPKKVQASSLAAPYTVPWQLPDAVRASERA